MVAPLVVLAPYEEDRGLEPVTRSNASLPSLKYAIVVVFHQRYEVTVPLNEISEPNVSYQRFRDRLMKNFYCKLH